MNLAMMIWLAWIAFGTAHGQEAESSPAAVSRADAAEDVSPAYGPMPEAEPVEEAAERSAATDSTTRDNVARMWKSIAAVIADPSRRLIHRVAHVGSILAQGVFFAQARMVAHREGAEFEALLGDAPKAVEHLEKAYALGLRDIAGLVQMSAFDGIRNAPEFVAFLAARASTSPEKSADLAAAGSDAARPEEETPADEVPSCPVDATSVCRVD